MKAGDLVKPSRWGIWDMPNQGCGLIAEKKKYSGIKDPLYRVYWSDPRFDNKRWIHPSDLTKVLNESSCLS